MYCIANKQSKITYNYENIIIKLSNPMNELCSNVMHYIKQKPSHI